MISINTSKIYFLFKKYSRSTYSYPLQLTARQDKIKKTKIIKSNCQASEKLKKLLLKPVFQFSKNKKLKDVFGQLLNHPYSRLCRWDKPAGALLLYWPCLWGLEAGAHGLMIQNLIPLYLLFLMGSWTIRSAGCIINDYLDKDYDKNVQRCKSRPLASEQLTTKDAAILLFLNLCGGLIVLSQMNYNSFLATLMVIPIAGLYPLAKRFVKHPQAVLGSVFNSGVFICALTVNPLSPEWKIVIPLYLSGVCWTMIYDTIYAFQDIEDDKKMGLKSTAIQWEKSITLKMNQMMVLSLLLTSSLVYFEPKYIYSLPIFIAAHIFLKFEINKVSIKNKSSCNKFFKKNNIFGLAIFIGLLVKRIVEEEKMDKSSNQSK